MFKRKSNSQYLYILIDLIVMALCFMIPYLVKTHNTRALSNFEIMPDLKGYCLLYAIWTLLLVVTLKVKELYTTDRTTSISDEMLAVFSSVFFTSILAGSSIFVLKLTFFSRQVFLANSVMLIVLLAGWRTCKRILLRRLITKGFNNINVLIVNAGQISQIVAEEIRKHSYLGLKIIGFLDDTKSKSIEGIPVLGNLSDFFEIAQKHFIDEVVIGLPSNHKMKSKIIKEASKLRLGIRIIPEQIIEPQRILGVSHVGVIPLLTLKESTRHPAEAFSKRLFDIFVSGMALVSLSLLLVIVGMLIKLESKGPIFFKQKRYGIKGRVFHMYKFRSMIQGADKHRQGLMSQNEVEGGVIFKMKKDPRITRVGRFIRRYSIDEIPQLLNVFRGDMSIVGPRPLPLDQVQNDDFRQMKRLEIKPGITGLPQIKGRSDLPFSRWIKWDLFYIKRWSLMLDMKIILWTIPAVLKGKGAY